MQGNSDLDMGSPVFIYACMGSGSPFDLVLSDKLHTGSICKQGEFP